MLDRSADNQGAALRFTPLIRVLVGPVFFLEGIQKFVYPAIRGPGRFEGIGFSNPEFWAYLVGGIEVVCGLLITLGLATRLAAVPTAAIMVVAIVTTKVPVLLGRALGPLALREVPYHGFLSMAHEARTDWAMLLGSLFLILVGAGPWSLDRWLSTRAGKSPRNDREPTRDSAITSGPGAVS